MHYKNFKFILIRERLVRGCRGGRPGFDALGEFAFCFYDGILVWI